MPTVFETLSDKFYTAFFEADSEKRRAAIEAWIKDATPVVQSAVENELRSYLEYLLEQTWTVEGWQSRAKKFSGTILHGRPQRKVPFTDLYRLVLRLRVERPLVSSGEKLHSVDPASSEAHAEALRIAQQTLSQIDLTEATKLTKQRADAEAAAKSSHQSPPVANADEDDDDYNEDDGGRSPNDDRSDSMNPNNDAYWSSRGR